MKGQGGPISPLLVIYDYPMMIPDLFILVSTGAVLKAIVGKFRDRVNSLCLVPPEPYIPVYP